MFCLSPETSNLFLTREYLIITRSVQSDRRYCPYNNEGVDEIIPPLFLHSIPLLLQIVMAAFSTRSLKTSIVSISVGIEYTKSFLYPKKSHGNSLRSRSTLAHFTVRQHNYVSMCSLFENKRAIFTKF
jgi:hypothetical protein